MKKLYFFIIFIILINIGFSQDSTVNWLTFDQVKDEFTKKQKPILIFAYQQNDSLSEKMFNTTFSNTEVAKYINLLFYPVKFDIHSKDTMTFFNGDKFPYNPITKYNSLTHMLIGDSIVTPTLIMFDEQAKGRVFYGYKNRDSIFPILINYHEKIYVSTSYEDWEKLYFEAYPPGHKQIITHLNIKWMTMEEMLEKQKTAPRKVFIDIYNNYNIAQTVMRLQVYNYAKIANYINSHYYPVTLGYTSDETFEIKGQTYKNSNDTYKFHEFAIAVLNAKMQFPAFVILDEDFNLLDRIQVFTTRESYNKIIHYYGDNAYKEIDFKNYKLNK